MRLRRVLFAALLVSSGTAHADILGLGRLAQAGGGAGGIATAPSSDDLAAWAGPARKTTLPELLQVAIRQAPALATARIDIAIAEARIQQTWVRNDWTISAALGSELSIGTRSGSLDSVTGTGSLDVIVRIPSGGTIGMHASSDYSRVELPGGLEDRQWFDKVGLSITQPLLQGRGRAVFEAAERRASLERDVAVLARRLAAIDTVQTIVSAYWDLVLAERQVQITRASLELANERLRITTIGTSGGKVPRAEIPAVQQIIATREEAVLDGELAVLDRSIALRRAAGMPIGAGELGLAVDAELATGDTRWDLGPLVERAYTASPELAELAKQGDSATIEIAVTENDLLPRLDATLQLGPIGTDTTFGGAWTHLGKVESLGVSGSLTFRQSLHRDDVRGRARELRETRRKLQINAADLRAQIAQTMAQAVAQLELARRRVTLSERAISLAKENIQIETDRFNLGKATNFDVLNRQEELRQAELRRAQAMIDWHKAESVVQALTGDLLPTYGIVVE